MYKLYIIFILIFIVIFNKTFSQTDSFWQQKPGVNISGFVDVFYAYDFNQPINNYRQSFLFNHNRHNEFNINLGYIKLNVEQIKYRMNLALQAGTYANDNYAAEPGLLKNIFEANAGISLSKENKLWLDAGVFASHIGFESAISIDNWTLTRSLLAENSPYFISGVKLTYNPNNKLTIATLICNGWQRIQRLEGNSLPSFGTQVSFNPNDKITLNWSTFIGTDVPDNMRQMRYFNNFYGKFYITKKLGLIAGFDIGAQQEVINSSVYDIWLSPIIITQYAVNKNWKAAFRIEYYQDESGVIIPTKTANGFKTTGFSLNFDYTPAANIACRLEGRWLNSEDKIFETPNSFANNNFFIVSSIAIKFSEMIIK